MVIKFASNLAQGTVSEKYSKLSGLSSGLHAQRVRTAAISGKTSANFSELINTLRDCAPGVAIAATKTGTPASDNGVVDIDIKANAAAAKATATIAEKSEVWLSEKELADAVQESIKGPGADLRFNILLPASVMDIIPLSVRENTALQVARYLQKIRLVLLEQAFPGASELLYKTNEFSRDTAGGTNHVEMGEIVGKSGRSK